MNDPIKIAYLNKKGLVKTKSLTDQEHSEYCMYNLTKYYIRDVFRPGTNVQLREFLNETIKDQKESFNE